MKLLQHKTKEKAALLPENDVVMTSEVARKSSECADMKASVREVEKLLGGYKFKDKKLLEEALTHKSSSSSSSSSSCCSDITQSSSSSYNYERLEYLGDAALGFAISDHMFKAYPHADEDQLTKLRSVNVSTEKLARAAVRHRLYRFLRRNNTDALDNTVKDFTKMVEQEVKVELYGGDVEAPLVLADIVESIAGAMYVDSDLDTMWKSFKGLLEPIVSLEELLKRPHPIDFLKRSCERVGKPLKIKCPCPGEGEEFVASVYILGELIAFGRPCKKKDTAKLQAAMAALQALPFKNIMCDHDDEIISSMSLEREANGEIQEAKKKLKELCEKKKWPQPNYSLLDRIGPPHEERFVYSVEIATVVDSTMIGDEKSRIREAENSAASKLLCKMSQRQGNE